MVCGLTDSALSEADTTDKIIIIRKMSATATTTLSDTLVVGRQPQQSVGIHSVFRLPSPTTSSTSRISGSPSPSSIPPATRNSNGLDPQFTSVNRPGGVRFSPHPRLNKHTHFRPTQAIPLITTCGMRPVCCRLLSHRRVPRSPVVWDRLLCVMIVPPMWKG